MRSWIGLIVVIVLIVGAILLFVYYFHTGSRARAREEVRSALQQYFLCEFCNREFLGEGGSPTAICPECGVETIVIRIKKRCKDCGKEFVQFELDTETNTPRLPGGVWNFNTNTNLPCPECGSKDLIGLPEKR